MLCLILIVGGLLIGYLYGITSETEPARSWETLE